MLPITLIITFVSRLKMRLTDLVCLTAFAIVIDIKMAEIESPTMDNDELVENCLILVQQLFGANTITD